MGIWYKITDYSPTTKCEPTQIERTSEALELPYMYVSWFQWNLKSNSAVQWSEVRIATYDELGIYGGKSLISGYTHTQCDPIFKVGNKFMAIWLITHKQKLYPFTAEDYCTPLTLSGMTLESKKNAHF